MSSEVARRSFNGHWFDFLEINGIIWVDARQVFEVFYGDAVKAFDDTEVLLGSVSSHNWMRLQDQYWLSESGMYLLAMRTDCASCRSFATWVSEDVLPSLRRTGRYEMESAMTPALPRTYLDALKALVVNEERRELLSMQVAELAPKARMADEFIEPEGWIPNREAAKILYGAITRGPNRLLEVLRVLRILYYSSDRHLLPYQDPWVNAHLIRSQRVPVNGRLRPEIQYSPRGLVRVYEKLRAHGEDVLHP